MDLICQDLGIPRRHIRESRHPDRYSVLVHKSWLKCLTKHKKLCEFKVYSGGDLNGGLRIGGGGDSEWPINSHTWTVLQFSIHQKYCHKVVPLSQCRIESSTTTKTTSIKTTASVNTTIEPLCFSQILQYISQTNHQQLWKSAYKKYSSSGRTNNNNQSQHQNSNFENNFGKPSVLHTMTTLTTVPYDTVLRDAIQRIYGCSIIHAQLDRYVSSSSSIIGESVTFVQQSSPSPSTSSATQIDTSNESHPNLYPIYAAIETSSHFVLIHSANIELTLMDCVTYSPAIMDKSHNKPLFLIYQLLQLLKSFQSRDLFFGNIHLTDIYLTENLWLNVMPKLEANVLQLDQIEDETKVVIAGATVSPSIDHASLSNTNNNNNNTAVFTNHKRLQHQQASFTKYTQPLATMESKYSVKDYCEMWCLGQLSNYDYLSILNNLSGRRLGCPGSHHIMPWVSDFTARSGQNLRDLNKSKYRLNKGDAQLDLMFQSTGTGRGIGGNNGGSIGGVVGGSGSVSGGVYDDVPHHVSDMLSEITYYVYMARRTSKQLLCKFVRPIWVPAEYPANIQRLQEWTPDECIPEFYSDPLVFKSIHEDLPDLEVPAWASCPEDFITKHRETLESQYVSERLHHWIDLNFGYKLTGAAAVKAKNVCLSLVNEHKTLCERGIVQLFTHPHPSKQFQTPWTSKIPPRIYSHQSSKRRLTRSSEDLSNTLAGIGIPSSSTTTSASTNFFSAASTTTMASPPSQCNYQSPTRRNHSPNILDETTTATTNMERSTSYHINVQKSTQNQICLPKDYNPVAALSAVENMEIFLSKTFCQCRNHLSANNGGCVGNSCPQMDFSDIFHNAVSLSAAAAAPPSSVTSLSGSNESGGNAFTNRIFSETYEANLMTLNKDFKRLHNTMHKNRIVRNSTRNYKHLVAEQRNRELQVIGCIIVEIFLAQKLRPLGVGSANAMPQQTLDERLATCLGVLKYHFEQLPKCVQYPVRLLLRMDELDGGGKVITDRGLPQPTAEQILQPLLNNILFPFPFNYGRVYTLITSLMNFDCVAKYLALQTFFQCDGQNCEKFEQIDRTRVLFNRKIAECKVKACVIQIDALLDPIGYEQFNPIELILPHFVDLLRNSETSTLTAWHLFDGVATALGPHGTLIHLLHPLLRLYDADNDERVQFLNSNFDNSMKFTTSSLFKSRKTYKLYHHIFLLKLIVRFGLREFLEHFVPPLIEAVGGYKEPFDEHSSYHFHEKNACRKNSGIIVPGQTVHGGGVGVGVEDEIKQSRSTKNLKYFHEDSFALMTKSVKNIELDGVELRRKNIDQQDEEMFAFEDGDQDGGSGAGECSGIDTSIKNNRLTNSSVDDSSDYDAENAILKIIDQFDLTSEGSIVDLRLNNSAADEVTESSTLVPDLPTSQSTSTNQSFDDAAQMNKLSAASLGPTSPTIPIPTFRRTTELNTIDCEIGSKKSFDSNEFLIQSPSKNTNSVDGGVTTDDQNHTSTSTRRDSSQKSKLPQNRISEMSAKSLIWLSHRLGPVLTARHLSRNLLKMLTLCYVGQENLLPDPETHRLSGNECDGSSVFLEGNLIWFSIADGRVIGDQSSAKVLDCLTAISALFGDQFVLLQYFPHVSEMIALCKKRITASLEGGLISALQLMKFLVPCLSDSTIMDQLHDVILKSIIHPIIRLLASSRCLMPSGFLARSVLARKLLDAIYVLAVRIGPEMTKDHLCVPALERFFLIFDKAYGISDHFKNNRHDDLLNCRKQNEASPSNSSDDSNFVEIRRESCQAREWCIRGSPIQIIHAKVKGESTLDNITPPRSGQHNTTVNKTPEFMYNHIQRHHQQKQQQQQQQQQQSPIIMLREKAQEEICDVFNPSLAHVAYVPFLKFLGEHIMAQVVKNLPLILNLCHEFEQPNYSSGDKVTGVGGGSMGKLLSPTSSSSASVPAATTIQSQQYHTEDINKNVDTVDSRNSNSFGTMVIGNRIDVQKEDDHNNDHHNSASNSNSIIGSMELLDYVTYKYDQINTARHLRGNWLAYWEHEIGRSDKDNSFNLKQIKLQTFSGHTNSVRSLLCLDNENSFMSASKDKTVKLWALRSEGDGTKSSNCQFTYTNHRKSVHSLSFLESLRLTVSCDSGVHLWDPFVGAQIGQLDSHKLTPVSVVKTYAAPSPLVLAGTAESTIKIIDARTLSYVNEWKVALNSCGSVRCIAVPPSGNWIACGLSSGQLILFDGRTGVIIASWKATDGELLQLIAPNDHQIVSSSLDSNICVWSPIDGSLLHQMRTPPEAVHCILSNNQELIFGTPGNRIGIFPKISPDAMFSITKLRSDTFRGVLTNISLLPLNRMLLIGGDNGVISLIC